VTRLAPFASLALLVAMAIVLVQNRGLVPLAILLALAALVAARQRFGAVARAAVAGPAAAALALAGWAILSAAWAIGAREALAGGLRLAAMVLVLGVILATVPEAPEARRRLGRAVLAAGGLALLRPALVRRALPAGLALVVLAGPPVLGEAAAAAARAGLLPLSAVHRLLIWDHAAERAAERPLLGFGMDAARSLPGGADRPDAARLDRLGIEGEIRAFFATGPAHAVHLLPLHTHSMPLQVRLELGLAGLAVFALFAYRCGRAVAALPSGAAFAAGTAAATAASGVGLLSYGVWQHWWWVA